KRLVGTARLLHTEGVFVRFDDESGGTGILEDMTDLNRRRRLIDGNEDRPSEGRSEVDEGPYVAHFAEEADLVAVVDPGSNEALRERRDLTVELGSRDIRPGVAVRHREQGLCRCRSHPIEKQVGDVRLRVRGDGRQGM